MTDTRTRLAKHVSATPGVHFNGLVEQSGLAPGQVQYHLRRLRADGVVRQERLYGKTHYYPPEYDDRERRALALLRRETARDVLLALLDDGEIASMEVGHGEAAKKRDGLLLEFPVGETELDSTDDVAWLFWDRDESREHGLAGFDAVTILGGEPSGRDLAALLRELIVTLIGR